MKKYKGGYGMADFMIVLILLAVLIPAVVYIVKAKKKGQKCIGCPNGSKCSGNCHCNGTK